jgi:hypothetical protein
MEMVFQASNNLGSGRPRGKLEGVWRSAFGVWRRQPWSTNMAGRESRSRESPKPTKVTMNRSLVGFALLRDLDPWPATPIPQPSLSLRSKAHPFAPG